LKEQLDVLRDFSVQVTRQPLMVVACCSPPLIQGFDRSYSNILVKNGYLFRKDGWFLPYLRVTLGNVSASYCFFRDNVRKIQAMVTRDRMQNVHGQLEIFTKENPLSTSAAQENFHATLQEIDRVVMSLGAIPAYVYLPASPDLRLPAYLLQSGESQGKYDFLLLDKLLQTHCATDKIHFIDLYPVLIKHQDNGEMLNFILDSHYNSVANRVIGEALYQAITEGGEIAKFKDPSGKQD
jgi:hypothetical protein